MDGIPEVQADQVSLEDQDEQIDHERRSSGFYACTSDQDAINVPAPQPRKRGRPPKAPGDIEIALFRQKLLYFVPVSTSLIGIFTY